MLSSFLAGAYVSWKWWPGASPWMQFVFRFEYLNPTVIDQFSMWCMWKYVFISSTGTESLFGWALKEIYLVIFEICIVLLKQRQNKRVAYIRCVTLPKLKGELLISSVELVKPCTIFLLNRGIFRYFLGRISQKEPLNNFFALVLFFRAFLEHMPL